jgi:hypothetical protein
LAPPRGQRSPRRSVPTRASFWAACRAGASLSAERITAFDRETRLTVLERGGIGTQVKNPETGQTGWRPGNYRKTIPEASPASTA